MPLLYLLQRVLFLVLGIGYGATRTTQDHQRDPELGFAALVGGFLSSSQASLSALGLSQHSGCMSKPILPCMLHT